MRATSDAVRYVRTYEAPPLPPVPVLTLLFVPELLHLPQIGSSTESAAHGTKELHKYPGTVSRPGRLRL